jgi:hypothetical protein
MLAAVAFRSAYDPATLAKMSAELETTFSPEDRIHFLFDVWSLVRVGASVSPITSLRLERCKVNGPAPSWAQ